MRCCQSPKQDLEKNTHSFSFFAALPLLTLSRGYVDGLNHLVLKISRPAPH